MKCQSAFGEILQFDKLAFYNVI